MPAVATGGGGMTSGTHSYVGAPFANHDLRAVTYGGFGYGVTDRGTRIGGFGVTIADGSDTQRLIGGFGGGIAGQELIIGPLSVAIVSWTGLGGIAATGLPASGGYFALFEELAVELGVAPLPWLQLVVYGGYQIVGSILPGFILDEAISHTPVFGIRMVFGSFR